MSKAQLLVNVFDPRQATVHELLDLPCCKGPVLIGMHESEQCGAADQFQQDAVVVIPKEFDDIGMPGVGELFEAFALEEIV